MNVQTAKANLVRAHAAFYSAQGWPFQDSPIARMREEMSKLAETLDVDDPAQAQILRDIIAVSDELKLAERHAKNAEGKIWDAVAAVVVYESTIKQI
jgi:hypothetical protein